MVNITVTVSESLKEELQRHKEVNWSAVIRKSLAEHIRKIDIAETIGKKSKLKKKDADEISKKIKRDIAKELGLI